MVVLLKVEEKWLLKLVGFDRASQGLERMSKLLWKCPLYNLHGIAAS